MMSTPAPGSPFITESEVSASGSPPMIYATKAFFPSAFRRAKVASILVMAWPRLLSLPKGFARGAGRNQGPEDASSAPGMTDSIQCVPKRSVTIPKPGEKNEGPKS